MTHDDRGHYGIAMLHPSHPENVGSMARAAGCFDADYMATIGHQYRAQTTAVGHDRHTPIWYFDSFRDLTVSLPHDTQVVAVDYDDDATPLSSFEHPERALYVLGEEGPGFEQHPDALDRAGKAVYIESEYCLNVAVAGSIVLQDRYASGTTEVYDAFDVEVALADTDP